MEKIKGIITDFKLGWKNPKKGNYVSYKEVAAYSVGGIGNQFIAAMVGQITLQANCLLIASVYGINPSTIATLSIISTIISLLIIPIRGVFMDNKVGKRGKYRPQILYTGLPLTILIILMAYIPTDLGENIKVVLVGGGTILITVLALQFYNFGYTNLVNVLTPNSAERTNIVAVSSILYSLAPTITGFAMPLISDSFGGLTSITTYRITFPIFAILGFVLGLFAYFGTKERIIVANNYVAKVGFIDGFKKIIKNKYFWIQNVSGWFTFMKLAFSFVLTWLYIYSIQNNLIMSVTGLIIGTASLIGMVSTPILIKKIGKKKLIIYTGILFSIATIFMAFFPNNAVIIMLVIYIANVCHSTTLITSPAITADVLDYQQWKTGDRLEGFSQNFGIINSVIGIGTALIIPFLLQYFGLRNNYNMLYDPAIRLPIFRMLAIVVSLGGLLQMAPYLFYDLSEAKHKEIIKDLKERALNKNRELGIEETLEQLENDIKG